MMRFEREFQGATPDSTLIEWKPSGRRIATKLYRTAKGWICNADIQAAANILKVASIPSVNLDEINRGSVTCPRRLNLYPTVLV